MGIAFADRALRAVAAQVINGGKQVQAELWFGDRVNIAGIRTITSHIKNMFVGVTKGAARRREEPLRRGHRG
jgi:hypothetical protein